MASSPADQPSTGTPAQSAPQRTGSRPSSGQGTLSTSPVEMKTLPPSATEHPSANTTSETADAAPNSTQEQTSRTQDATPSSTQEPAESITPPAPPKPTPPAELNRAETEAIGPSTDVPAAKPDNSNGPVVVITLLLTTGARHPYKIDEKYLKKRNVNVEAMDPYNITVYILKELIWRDWREEWEPRPTSPSSIRLIHFGRMLDDKSPLKECRFQTEVPNVVHMTVKPQEVVDEEDAKTGKGGGRRDGEEEAHAGCRCVIL